MTEPPSGMPPEQVGATPGPGRASGRPDRDGGGAALDWAVWAIGRLLLVAIVLRIIPWAEMFNDLAIYARWVQEALSHGRFPHDEMWQYPPLAAPVMVLAAVLPGDAAGYVLLLLGVDASIMAMVAAQARHRGATSGRRLWALAPLVVGPLLLARFDVVPTALAVAAVALAARPGASGAVAAVGAWVKVWPILVVAGLRRHDLPRAALGVVAASVVIAGVLVATTTDPLSFVGGQRDRGLQIESIAALPFLVARAVGLDVEVVYRYGAHEVQAPGAETVAAALPVLTLALLAVVGLLRLTGRLERLGAADVALATVLFSVATSRVFSGQYLIWLMGLAAVALSDPGTRMRHTIRLLIAVGVATQVVYPWLYSALLDGSPVAVLVQSVRVLLTLAATVTAAGVLLRAEPDGQASGSAPSSIARRRSAERSHPQDDSTH